MAKLTISEAARVAHVSRSTLHRAIKKGYLSLGPDGKVDTSELLRCGYSLQAGAQQRSSTVRRLATPKHSGARQVTTTAPQQVMEALQRERDLLQRELDATRDLLRSEREAALERERATREREALLLQMLQEAQRQSTRLLDIPRQVAPATVPQPADLRRRIVDCLRQHGRAMSPAEIQEALGLATTPRHIMRRMAEAGVLRRVEAGVYELA